MKPYQLKILATKRRAGYNVIAVGMVSEMLWIKQGRRGRPKGFSPKAAGYIQQVRYVNGRKVVVYVKPDTSEPPKKQRPQKASAPTAVSREKAKKTVNWLKQYIPPLPHHKTLLSAIEEGMTHSNPQSLIESYYRQPPPDLEPETIARRFGLFVGATLALKPELLEVQGRGAEKMRWFCEALTEALMPAPSRTWNIYITTDWRSMLTSEQFNLFMWALHEIKTNIVSRISTNETKLPYIEPLPPAQSACGTYDSMKNAIGLNKNEVTSGWERRIISTVTHELGHWLEHTKRLAHASRKLQQAAEQGTLTLVDDWGNTQKGNYAFKVYNMMVGETPVLFSTEVLSCGLANFFFNKQTFFKDAPLHFAYVHLAVTHADLPFK